LRGRPVIPHRTGAPIAIVRGGNLMGCSPHRCLAAAAREWGVPPKQGERQPEDNRGVADPDRRVTELIEAGRDREAAELGARGILPPATAAPTHPIGGPMDPLSQLDQLAPLLAGVVGGISGQQLNLPTPCAEFTVRGVLEHMIGGAAMFAAAYRGETPAEPDLGDVLAGFGPALADLGAAIGAPGALDRTVVAPFGEVTGETFARFVVLDGLVHGWDLAMATDQAYDPPADLVAAVDGFAHRTLDPLRDGQTFAAAVEPAADSSPIERLVAYTGRRP
jgi:uncharacterized protein (TIGR03086 family)